MNEYEEKYTSDLDVIATFGGWFQPRFKFL